MIYNLIHIFILNKMRILHALLIILLVSLYKGESCTLGNRPSKPTDCHNREFDKIYYKCCYLHTIITSDYKAESITCQTLDEYNFKHIEDFVKLQKELYAQGGHKVELYDINCSSSYLYISLLLLMLLLL